MKMKNCWIRSENEIAMREKSIFLRECVNHSLYMNHSFRLWNIYIEANGPEFKEIQLQIKFTGSYKKRV